VPKPVYTSRTGDPDLIDKAEAELVAKGYRRVKAQDGVLGPMEYERRDSAFGVSKSGFTAQAVLFWREDDA
jgi:hypothetical protein